ncbi:MAG: HAD family hydrolase [Vicinamibacteraceae bacterium]
MPQTAEATPAIERPAAVTVVALDWGHTLMDERRDRDIPLDDRPAHLMPGVREALAAITVPLAVWANTREGDERHVRAWLTRAGLDGVFSWVITSTDACARKPSARFFTYALARCGCAPADVLFVGNQLNTDVAGANGAGIRSVWLAGDVYRSDDDRPCAALPTYTIESLPDLPALVRRLMQPV